MKLTDAFLPIMSCILGFLIGLSTGRHVIERNAVAATPVGSDVVCIVPAMGMVTYLVENATVTNRDDPITTVDESGAETYYYPMGGETCVVGPVGTADEVLGVADAPSPVVEDL